jgi:geranylgeranyl diphosphate synthase type II
MAVEVFQFSLVHDDIMDDALAKRNMTVHEKWDVTGILSGDAMLILAYQYFDNMSQLYLCDWQNYLVKRRLKSVKDSNGMLILK